MGRGKTVAQIEQYYPCRLGCARGRSLTSRM
jgi:hypothetical protein